MRTLFNTTILTLVALTAALTTNTSFSKTNFSIVRGSHLSTSIVQGQAVTNCYSVTNNTSKPLSGYIAIPQPQGGFQQSIDDECTHSILLPARGSCRLCHEYSATATDPIGSVKTATIGVGKGPNVSLSSAPITLTVLPPSTYPFLITDYDDNSIWGCDQAIETCTQIVTSPAISNPISISMAPAGGANPSFNVLSYTNDNIATIPFHFANASSPTLSAAAPFNLPTSIVQTNFSTQDPSVCPYRCTPGLGGSCPTCNDLPAVCASVKNCFNTQYLTCLSSCSSSCSSSSCSSSCNSQLSACRDTYPLSNGCFMSYESCNESCNVICIANEITDCITNCKMNAVSGPLYSGISKLIANSSCTKDLSFLGMTGELDCTPQPPSSYKTIPVSYVTNAGNNSVTVCQGNTFTDCSSYSDASFFQPQSIAVLEDDGVAYVVNSNNTLSKCSVSTTSPTIGALSHCTKITNATLNNTLDDPKSIALSPSHTYADIINKAGQNISIYHLTKGVIDHLYDPTGADFDSPLGIIVVRSPTDSSQNIAYLTNKTNVSKCNIDRTTGQMVGCTNSNFNAFTRAAGIAANLGWSGANT